MEEVDRAVTNEMKEIVIMSWIKTIAAFGNSNGGELLIGIGEDKDGTLELLGLEKDLKHLKSKDNILTSLDDIFAKYIGNEYHRLIKSQFVSMDANKIVLYIKVEKSNNPIFVRVKKGEEAFYIRRNASSIKLSMSEAMNYKFNTSI